MAFRNIAEGNSSSSAWSQGYIYFYFEARLDGSSPRIAYLCRIRRNFFNFWLDRILITDRFLSLYDSIFSLGMRQDMVWSTVEYRRVLRSTVEYFCLTLYLVEVGLLLLFGIKQDHEVHSTSYDSSALGGHIHF